MGSHHVATPLQISHVSILDLNS